MRGINRVFLYYDLLHHLCGTEEEDLGHLLYIKQLNTSGILNRTCDISESNLNTKFHSVNLRS